VKKEAKEEPVEGKISEELDILTQLEKAKKEAIETLKTPKRELIKTSNQQINEGTTTEEQLIPKNDGNKVRLTEIEPEYMIPSTFQESKLFFEEFGNLQTIDIEFINKFKINNVNLINSRVVNPDFLDLENLFYYVSILKLLNIDKFYGVS